MDNNVVIVRSEEKGKRGLNGNGKNTISKKKKHCFWKLHRT